jgi:hypothetical protein
MSRYNLNLISGRRSYTIGEISSLLGVNRRTCGRWIRKEGLKVIKENTSPLLILGEDLIDLIKKKRNKIDTPLKENEFYCLKCHKAVRAKISSEQIIKTGKRLGKDNHEQLKKIGICENCGKPLNKFLGVERRD